MADESPQPDSAQRESSKQRALRIPLDHAARPDRLLRTKWLLSLTAALVAVLYTVWIGGASPEPNKAFSPGTVAHVHAAWDHQCSVCHPSFTPVRSDALGANTPAHRLAVEQKCQACHAGAPHHAVITTSGKAQEETCAACHRDHQGSAASLLAIEDSHCTRCHADLKSPHSGGEKSTFALHVTSFTAGPTKGASAEKGHPEFRSLAADPGTIKFNHAIHMTAGLPGAVKDGRPLLSYKQLFETSPQAFRTLVPQGEKRVNDAAPVQLECRSCHQSEAVDRDILSGKKKGDAVAHAPSDGAYMLPIQFEQHCQACHPLNYDEQPSHVVPHGLPAAELKAAVFGQLVSETAKPLPATTKDELQQKLLGKPDALIAAAPESQAERLNRIEDLLTNVRCNKCHEFPAGGKAFSTTVASANIPAAWFKHAKFNHAPHRMVQCVDCHRGADPQTHDAKKKDEEVVMIPNYELCVQCHSPRGSREVNPAFAPFAGARSDCVECHAYHGGDHPLTGVGSWLRGVGAAKQP